MVVAPAKVDAVVGEAEAETSKLGGLLDGLGAILEAIGKSLNCTTAHQCNKTTTRTAQTSQYDDGNRREIEN